MCADKGEKKSGPDPEMLKIEGFSMEEVAKRMLATSTDGDWEAALEKMKSEDMLSADKKEDG